MQESYLLIPIKIKPLEHEILSSWLIRSAIVNGIDPIGFTNGIWFNYRAWTRDISRYLSSNKIKTLSEVSTLSYRDVFNLTLKSVLEPILSKSELLPKKAWKWVIPIGTRNRSRTNGLYFCPLCLKDKPIFLRKEWRLSWNFSCERHKILLQLNCPQCHTVFSPHLINYNNTDITRCQNCNYSLKESLSYPSDTQATNLQSILNNAISNKTIPTNSFPLIDNTLKDFFITIRILLILFRNFTRHQNIKHILLRELGLTHLNSYYSPTHGNTLDSISANERHFLFTVMSRLFKLSLEEVIMLFRQARITKEILATRGMPSSNTITYISSRLESRNKKNFTTIRKKPTICVRNKESIELLMSDIRQYL